MSKSILIFIFQILSFSNNVDIGESTPIFGNNVETIRNDSFPFPFLVSIGDRKDKIKYKSETEGHFCCGSLITRKHVLTSAHCIERRNVKNIEITVGTNDLEKGERFIVKSAITYYEWASNMCLETYSFDHDIAVLTLYKCVSEDIELPRLTRSINSDFYGKTVRIAGWGETNEEKVSRFLNTAMVQVLSQTECFDKIKISFDAEDRFFAWDSYLCTNADPFTLIGLGDSGSPVLINENEIIGITDSIHPSRKTYPRIPIEERVSVHLNVLQYTSFINNVIKTKRNACSVM